MPLNQLWIGASRLGMQHPGHSPADPAPSRVPKKTRFDGIDFWRGTVLCTIFINHVPGNLFESLTHKNFGFSDSAEAFVFLFGVSLALAYGPMFVKQPCDVVHSLAKRAVKLYAVHILVSIIGLTVFGVGAEIFENQDLMQEHGRDLFVEAPGAALLGLFSLGHQLGYFNILPMYVVMIGFVPAQLWLAHRSRVLMLVTSSLLYLVARLEHWNVPAWPIKGEWFFDPFTWQLLLAGGLVVGLRMRAAPLSAGPRLAATAAAVLAFGVVCATDGLSFWPGLHDAVRERADLDKTMLGAGRLVHFAALAYLIAWLRLPDILRGSTLHRALCRLGRNGLWAFACLSVLSAGAQVLTRGLGHSLGLDLLAIGGGLTVLFASATLAESHLVRWRQTLGARAS